MFRQQQSLRLYLILIEVFNSNTIHSGTILPGSVGLWRRAKINTVCVYVCVCVCVSVRERLHVCVLVKHVLPHLSYSQFIGVDLQFPISQGYNDARGPASLGLHLLRSLKYSTL